MCQMHTLAIIVPFMIHLLCMQQKRIDAFYKHIERIKITEINLNRKRLVCGNKTKIFNNFLFQRRRADRESSRLIFG